MKTLIIPDIHLNIKDAQIVLNEYSYDKVIFLGDYFHQFGDTTKQNEEVAIWLKRNIKELGDKATWLFGNHDMCHAFPSNVHLQCPGFTPEKDKAINSVLTQEDWGKLKLFHYEEGFYFSHAGIHPYIFSHPVEGLTHKSIQGYCDAAMEAAHMRVAHPVTCAGKGRCGRMYRGGITWLDWQSEFQPIEGINQVVGHSFVRWPDTKEGTNSENWNFDTSLEYIGIMEDGEIEYQDV